MSSPGLPLLLLVVFSAPPAGAPDAGGGRPLKRWSDGARAWVQLVSDELELPGDEHCRAWVELTAPRPAAGKVARVQLGAVRWAVDSERWKGVRPKLLIDGVPAPTRPLGREAHGIETIDCAGLSESVVLELPVSTVARLPAAGSAVLVVGRDRIDLKAALGPDIATFLAALEPASRPSGSE